MPLDAEDEDEQKLQFTIKGDEDGRAVDYLYKFTVTFSVNKPAHGIVVDRLLLNPGTVQCGELFTATAEVYNTGSDDEFVGLEVKSAELEIDNNDLFQLDEEDGDGEGFAKKNYQFRVPADTSEGQYLLQASAFYNNDKDVSDPALATLQVVCSEEEPAEDVEDAEEDENAGTVIVDNTLTAQPQLPAIQGGVVGVPVEEEVSGDSFRESDTYMVVLSVLAGLALIVLVALGATLLKKKR